jgi:hypothetical protein
MWRAYVCFGIDFVITSGTSGHDCRVVGGGGGCGGEVFRAVGGRPGVRKVQEEVLRGGFKKE